MRPHLILDEDEKNQRFRKLKKRKEGLDTQMTNIKNDDAHFLEDFQKDSEGKK